MCGGVLIGCGEKRKLENAFFTAEWVAWVVGCGADCERE